MFKRRKKQPARRDPIVWWDMPERLTKNQRAALAQWIRNWSGRLDGQVAFYGTEGIYRCKALLNELANEVEGSEEKWEPPIQNMTPEQKRMVSRLNRAVKFIFDPKLSRAGFVRRRIQHANGDTHGTRQRQSPPQREG